MMRLHRSRNVLTKAKSLKSESNFVAGRKMFYSTPSNGKPPVSNGANGANGANGGNGASNGKPGFSSVPSANTKATVPETPKKSSFPWFSLTVTVAVSSLAYLAYGLEQEEDLHPMAYVVANQPYVEDALQPFRSAVQQLQQFGVIEKKKPAAPARPVSPVIFDQGYEPETFHDSQTQFSDVTVSDHNQYHDVSSHVDHQEESSTGEDAYAARSITDAEAAEVVDVVSEAQHSAPVQEVVDTVVATQVEESSSQSSSSVSAFSDEPYVTHAHPSHEEKPAASHSSALPHVHSESSMKNLQNSGSMGEVLGTVAKNSIALRHELETILLKDIDKMDAEALRIRITQLAAEMFERLSWESVRLSHSVRVVETELTQKYEELMAKQRKELEFEVTKLLFERERELEQQNESKVKDISAKFQTELQNTIKAQAEGFNETLKKELETQAKQIQTQLQDEINHHLAMIRKSHADKLMEIQPKIESLNADLKKYNEVFDNTKDAVSFTLKSHSISSAVLALEIMLSSSTAATKGTSVASKLDHLKKLCKEDTLVTNLLEGLPSRVQRGGALSVPELQVRFHVMRDEVRKAALAPEAAPKLIGQLVGTVLASISLAPKGYVTGEGTEEVLARAAYYLERGRLKECVKEVDSVKGYSSVLMDDWKLLAKDRLIVDQALRTLKADSIVRHKSFDV